MIGVLQRSHVLINADENRRVLLDVIQLVFQIGIKEIGRPTTLV